MTSYFPIFLVFWLATFSSLANDGVYNSSGGAIYPTQETKIAMQKEDLHFSVRDKMASVKIRFEFNNPEATPRTLLVGFQAPGSSGDVLDSLANNSRIENFTIMQNGLILPYTFKKAECKDCELKNPDEITFTQSSPGIFVYLFEVTFQPGVNVIEHSYSFPASGSIAIDESYNYILTTGAQWAGGKIGDLTIHIDQGENQFFYVKDTFGASAEWSIIGSGKVTDASFQYGEFDSRMIRTLNGSLQIHLKDFIPKNNLEFGVVNDFTFISLPLYSKKIFQNEIYQPSTWGLDSTASAQELRMLRNTIYAQHGYAFKSAELQAYFGQFEWYLPNPNLKMSEIAFTRRERDYLDKILQLESEK